MRYDQVMLGSFEPRSKEITLIDLVNAQFLEFCDHIELDSDALDPERYSGLLQVFFDGWRLGANAFATKDPFPSDLRTTMLETLRNFHEQEASDVPWQEPTDRLALAIEPVFGAGWKAGHRALKQGLVLDRRN